MKPYTCPAEACNAAGFERKGLDDAHAVDTLAQILTDRVIRGADGAIQRHEFRGLEYEDRQPGDDERQRHQTEQGVVPAEHADGGQRHQRGFEYLPPKVDECVANLVGVAGGPSDEFDAVPPMVGQVEPLHLDQDALAQNEQQVLADDQRQDAGQVLQDAPAE